MGRFTKRLIAGAAAVAMLAGGAFAQFLVDDLEHGGNEHRLDNYWYYFVSDDEDKLEKAVSEPGMHNHIIVNAGPGDDYGPMTFSAHSASGRGGGHSASLSFRNWTLADATAWPVVGMGMLLTGDDNRGFGSTFANVDSIEFWARGTAGLTFIFKVETIENSPDGAFEAQVRANAQADKDLGYDRWNMNNAYATKRTAAEGWARYVIAMKPIVPSEFSGQFMHPGGGTTGYIANPNFTGGRVSGSVGGGNTTSNTGAGLPSEANLGLAQFGWWGYSFTFNPANATKIAWQINMEDNAVDEGEFFVDDIRFIGSFNYTSPNICTECVGRTKPDTGTTLLSDFENDDEFQLLQNNLGYYWYAYSDEAVGGGAVISGVWREGWDGDEILDARDNGNGSNGPRIEFENGGRFNHSITGELISSFSGIGTNLYPDGTTDFFNAGALEYTGIYFEFMADGGVTHVSVEVSDGIDIAHSEANGDDGQIYHVRLPVASGTQGQWQTVVVPFSRLVLPLWVNNENRRRTQPLDLTQLAKIQFKVEGAVSGVVALDNVYWLSGSSSVRHTAAARAAGMRATYNRGVVGVNWNAASTIASGKISLVNTQGRVISSTPITNVSGNRITASLGSGIPTGMYFVRIDAKDMNGKRIVQQAPISIVK